MNPAAAVRVMGGSSSYRETERVLGNNYVSE